MKGKGLSAAATFIQEFVFPKGLSCLCHFHLKVYQKIISLIVTLELYFRISFLVLYDIGQNN